MNVRIVVGVDGSDAALHAASWAAGEAVARNATLRLVHAVVDPPRREVSTGGLDIGIEYAEQCLRNASEVVQQSCGCALRVETDIISGDVDAVLIKESYDAGTVYVGSSGIGPISQAFLGSTAAAVALHAHSAVAVVMSATGGAATGSHWIVAVIDDPDDSDLVLTRATFEATVSGKPILALGVSPQESRSAWYESLERHISMAKQRIPDLDIHPMVTHKTGPAFLAHNAELPVHLVVVGESDAGSVADYIGLPGPGARILPGHSVVVAR